MTIGAGVVVVAAAAYTPHGWARRASILRGGARTKRAVSPTSSWAPSPRMPDVDVAPIMVAYDVSTQLHLRSTREPKGGQLNPTAFQRADSVRVSCGARRTTPRAKEDATVSRAPRSLASTTCASPAVKAGARGGALVKMPAAAMNRRVGHEWISP